MPENKIEEIDRGSFLSGYQAVVRAVDISHMNRFGVELETITPTCRIRTTQTKYSRLSPRTMASSPPCLPVDPIGRRPNSRYSVNGRTTATSRDLFSRSRAA